MEGFHLVGIQICHFTVMLLAQNLMSGTQDMTLNVNALPGMSETLASVLVLHGPRKPPLILGTARNIPNLQNKQPGKTKLEKIGWLKSYLLGKRVN